MVASFRGGRGHATSAEERHNPERDNPERDNKVNAGRRSAVALVTGTKDPGTRRRDRLDMGTPLRRSNCRRAGRGGLFVATGLAVPLILAACGSSPSAHSAPPATTSAPAAASSGSADTVKTASVGNLGTVLVDSSGATLYTLKPESDGQIHCTGSCATTWPPLTISSGSPSAGSGVHGTLATMTRPEGTTQVTFDGKPLYRYAGDRAPGQANGQGIGGVWYVVSASSAGAGAGAAPTTTAGNGYGSGY